MEGSKREISKKKRNRTGRLPDMINCTERRKVWVSICDWYMEYDEMILKMSSFNCGGKRNNCVTRQKL